MTSLADGARPKTFECKHFMPDIILCKASLYHLQTGSWTIHSNAPASATWNLIKDSLGCSSSVVLAPFLCRKCKTWCKTYIIYGLKFTWEWSNSEFRRRGGVECFDTTWIFNPSLPLLLCRGNESLAFRFSRLSNVTLHFPRLASPCRDRCVDHSHPMHI